MKLQAAIFDMDGLLIDSEPFWQEAEAAVFGALGVPLTREMCYQTVGMRIEEAVAYWRERYPWQGRDDGAVADDVMRRVRALVSEQGRPMPGALDAVRLFRERGLALAVATSSRMALAQAVLAKLDLSEAFPVISTAQNLPHGKPHPGVYLAAARLLDVEPQACLAIEDSGSGVLSAKAAGMRVVAVPFHAWRDDERLGEADAVLDSLSGLSAAWLDRFQDGLAG